MDHVECIIVGAGVVGLAIARRLAQDGREVIVLEATAGIGNATSSRSSEVIHAGLYYPADSLMARTCVSGRRALYAYCADHGVPFRQCGKLIVATSQQDMARLAAIKTRAQANGVTDLVLLDASELRVLEPALNGVAALLSPSTGIIDSHAYMLALRGDAEDNGAAFAFSAPLRRAKSVPGGFIVDVGGHEPATITCRHLINAAGLEAGAVARTIEGLAPAHIPPTYYAKGNYFSCMARPPFSRLIYPVPEPGGLGVHLTFDLAGQARFGPDLEWVETIDYTVDPLRAERFYPAIRRYWPELPDGALIPGYAGIRPKIVSPAVAIQDFAIQDARSHGVDRLVNLFGIESPGLTASLAIADYAASMLES